MRSGERHRGTQVPPTTVLSGTALTGSLSDGQYKLVSNLGNLINQGTRASLNGDINKVQEVNSTIAKTLRENRELFKGLPETISSRVQEFRKGWNHLAKNTNLMNHPTMGGAARNKVRMARQQLTDTLSAIEREGGAIKHMRDAIQTGPSVPDTPTPQTPPRNTPLVERAATGISTTPSVSETGRTTRMGAIRDSPEKIIDPHLRASVAQTRTVIEDIVKSFPSYSMRERASAVAIADDAINTLPFNSQRHLRGTIDRYDTLVKSTRELVSTAREMKITLEEAADVIASQLTPRRPSTSQVIRNSVGTSEGAKMVPRDTRYKSLSTAPPLPQIPTNTDVPVTPVQRSLESIRTQRVAQAREALGQNIKPTTQPETRRQYQARIRERDRMYGHDPVEQRIREQKRAAPQGQKTEKPSRFGGQGKFLGAIVGQEIGAGLGTIVSSAITSKSRTRELEEQEELRREAMGIRFDTRETTYEHGER